MAGSSTHLAILATDDGLSISSPSPVKPSRKVRRKKREEENLAGNAHANEEVAATLDEVAAVPVPAAHNGYEEVAAALGPPLMVPAGAPYVDAYVKLDDLKALTLYAPAVSLTDELASELKQAQTVQETGAVEHSEMQQEVVSLRQELQMSQMRHQESVDALDSATCLVFAKDQMLQSITEHNEELQAEMAHLCNLIEKMCYTEEEQVHLAQNEMQITAQLAQLQVSQMEGATEFYEKEEGLEKRHRLLLASELRECKTQLYNIHELTAEAE